jgi:hypothetical protein
MKTIKTLFILFFISFLFYSMLLSILLTLDDNLSYNKFIHDYYDILIFITFISSLFGFISLFILIQYFGNKLWKKQEDYQKIIEEYQTKNVELNEMITKLGKHEAFKNLNKTE